MVKLRIEEEQKAAAVEQERIRCESLAVVTARKRSKILEEMKLAAEERKQVEEKLLEQVQVQLEQERGLLVQAAQRKALAAEAELAMQARIEAERLAVQAMQDKVTMEQVAINRAKEIVDSSNRLRKSTETLMADATEQHMAEEHRARHAAQSQTMLVYQVAMAERQQAEIKEQENARLRARMDHIRSKVTEKNWMTNLHNLIPTSGLTKTAGLACTLAFIGIMFYGKESLFSANASAGKSNHAAEIQAAKLTVNNAARLGLISESIKFEAETFKSDTDLHPGELKLSYQLKKN